MVRCEPCDKFLKLKTEEDGFVYVKKQHNICVNMLSGKETNSFSNKNLSYKIDKFFLKNCVFFIICKKIVSKSSKIKNFTMTMRF